MPDQVRHDKGGAGSVIIWRRILIVLLWTGALIAAFVGFMSLFYRFYGADCGPLDSVCARTGTFLVVAAIGLIAIIFGFGLGVMAQRWIFGRSRQS
jgi:hypothetical protein